MEWIERMGYGFVEGTVSGVFPDKVAIRPVHCVKEQLKRADEETNKRSNENR